jgi:RNA-directed DNA polymerase
MAGHMRATLQAIKAELRKRRHWPSGETSRWLRRVIQGWLNYHAIPNNSHRIERFVNEVTRIWLQVLRSRSQRGRRGWTWTRMQRLARRHLPCPRIVHPYPDRRFRDRLKAGVV